MLNTLAILSHLVLVIFALVSSYKALSGKGGLNVYMLVVGVAGLVVLYDVYQNVYNVQ